ncbi:MAG: redoxin domain-containing protein [Chloroherpetonaceae bacterium]|nr:redoxin domain-containing protein [Chloroherpetonaceae bacterium]
MQFLLISIFWLMIPDEVIKVGSKAPELLDGQWINSPKSSLHSQKGKVVLLHFWTFACYNCRNTIPSVNAWHKEFSKDGLVIIGIHTPEFGYEKKIETVKTEIQKLGIQYAVVTDNDYQTWNRYEQRYWPCIYLIDKKGIIRYIHIGEGNYDKTRNEIQRLLSEKSDE